MGKWMRLPALIGAAICWVAGAGAHEFWIEPLDYRIGAGDALVAHLRVGSDYKGNALSYFPTQFRNFDWSDATGTTPIPGRIGDRPAVDFVPESGGLIILSHVSTDAKLTWRERERFDHFVLAHDMGWVLESHAERGLPEVGFSEAYTRYVKSLVSVGDGAGQDRRIGLLIELVALANPYTDDISAGLPVSLVFQDAPLPDTKIDLFYRSPTGEVSRADVTTDAQGLALMPNLGAGEYMINVVHMVIPLQAETERTGAVWHSLWASLTYEISG